MPDATREQFDRMARKVAESAPEGLTREQFYARVNAELDKLGGADEGAAGSTYLGDVKNFAKGELRGAVAALNPVSWIRGPLELGRDLIETGGQRTIRGLQRVATEGNAGEVGELVGGVLGGAVTGKAVPAALPRVPGAMASTGRVVERVGRAGRKVSPFGMAEAAFRGDPKGLAVAVAPYAVEGAGKMLRRVGEWFQGDTPDLPPAPSVSATAARAPRSAGRTLSVGEERGVQQLDELLTALHGDDLPLKGNGTFREAAMDTPRLTRNPRIGAPRDTMTAWDASAGPALTPKEQALLAELQQMQPPRLRAEADPSRLLPRFTESDALLPYPRRQRLDQQSARLARRRIADEDRMAPPMGRRFEAGEQIAERPIPMSEQAVLSRARHATVFQGEPIDLASELMKIRNARAAEHAYPYPYRLR